MLEPTSSNRPAIEVTPSASAARTEAPSAEQPRRSMGFLPVQDAEPRAASNSESERTDWKSMLPGQAPSAEQQIQHMTRRSFATGGIAALVGTAGLWWLKNASLDDGISWPLRKVLQFNEQVSNAYFGPSRLAPTFDPSRAKDPRVNGRIGLTPQVDVARWRLDVLSPGEQPVIERSLPIGAIHELPRFEMVTEFKCVEGWSEVVQWAGARLSDFIEKYGHESPYVGLMTPNRDYYVGLDRASALHSQSLLAYEMNGKPLSVEHGAPLRLVCPLKYGVKSIKRIGAIQFSNSRPADYWAERGYDWYLGH